MTKGKRGPKPKQVKGVRAFFSGDELIELLGIIEGVEDREALTAMAQSLDASAWRRKIMEFARRVKYTGGVTVAPVAPQPVAVAPVPQPEPVIEPPPEPLSLDQVSSNTLDVGAFGADEFGLDDDDEDEQ